MWDTVLRTDTKSQQQSEVFLNCYTVDTDNLSKAKFGPLGIYLLHHLVVLVSSSIVLFSSN